MQVWLRWLVLNWADISLASLVFLSMARGVHPTERHNGKPFGPGDALFSGLSGQQCASGACLYLKADMLEFGTTYGFPATGHKHHPCTLCHTGRDSKIILANWDSISSPHRPKTFEEYQNACAACEIWVVVTKRQHTELRAIAEYDKRKNRSSRGLALDSDYAELGLRKGDRVEVCEGMIDAQDFENISDFPARVCFWRVGAETFAYHRNIIFNEETGILPHRSTALDWLHVLSLGVFQTWCNLATHLMFDDDVWGTRESNMVARLATTTNRLTSDIEKWQKLQAREGRDVTWIGVLDSDTFGSRTKPRFQLKGAQTNWYLEYLVRVCLPERVGKVVSCDGRLLLKAGQDLFRLLSLIREHPVTFPVASIQEFHDRSLSYLDAMAKLLVNPKPKDHALQHLSDRIQFQGSPAFYGNWLDESLNRLLRDVAAGAHASTHDRRVLLEWQKAYEGPPKKGRLH